MSCNNEITINSMESNQLKNETSLYLKQHAENPVNWQRWSNSIFNFSGELNKLVIVSIGYSSCHWCHVMENETFTDEMIAELMNDNGSVIRSRIFWAIPRMHRFIIVLDEITTDARLGVESTGSACSTFGLVVSLA